MFRTTLKNIVEIWVGYVATLYRYSFPAKYSWRWKLDVLLNRYEPETTSIVRTELKPGMVFVDIGAHIGYFSRLAARKVGREGRVISFEADSENAALLAKNTAHFPQVTRVEQAIADTEGTATFYHVHNSTGCHSLVKNENSESYEVSTTSLDSYLAKKRISHVDMIKMDIEGAEWKALDGMEQTLAQKNITLIMEYNPEALVRAGVQPHDLLRRLLALGFSVSILSARGTTPLNPAELGTIDKYLIAGSTNLCCVKMQA